MRASLAIMLLVTYSNRKCVEILKFSQENTLAHFRGDESNLIVESLGLLVQRLRVHVALVRQLPQDEILPSVAVLQDRLQALDRLALLRVAAATLGHLPLVGVQ